MNKKKKTKTTKLVAVPIHFVLPNSQGVCVAGTFNEWNPAATPLRHDGDHTWTATLRLPPGRYEYRLVADGTWRDVPDAAETVANDFGTRNAVLTVPLQV